MKNCPSCNELKELSCFSKCKQRKDGLKCYCKQCIKIKSAKRYEENRERILLNGRDSYAKNKEKYKISHKKYRLNTLEQERVRGKKWREKNKAHRSLKAKIRYLDKKEQIKAKHREYYKVNKIRVNSRHKVYRETNKEKERLRGKNYYIKNIDKIRVLGKLNVRRRRKEDIQFRIISQLRSRISEIIRRKSKPSSFKEYIGCTKGELISHLESQFAHGMSWDNYGKNGWHIDHIIPLSIFNLTDKEHFMAACHYTNLQPLWWFDNIKKSNSFQIVV